VLVLVLSVNIKDVDVLIKEQKGQQLLIFRKRHLHNFTVMGNAQNQREFYLQVFLLDYYQLQNLSKHQKVGLSLKNNLYVGIFIAHIFLSGQQFFYFFTVILSKFLKCAFLFEKSIKSPFINGLHLPTLMLHLFINVLGVRSHLTSIKIHNIFEELEFFYFLMQLVLILYTQILNLFHFH